MQAGYTQVVSVEFTRPANTTPYTAKDVVGPAVAAVGVLSGIGRYPANSGYLTKVRVQTDNKAYLSRLRVHFYTVAPTAIADNSPMALLYADRASRIGSVELPALSTEDATASDSASAHNADIRLAFQLEAGSRDMKFVLEDLDGGTPASGQKFYVEVTAELN